MNSAIRRSRAELIQELERLQTHIDVIQASRTNLLKPSHKGDSPALTLEGVMKLAHEPVLLLDSTLHVQNANKAFFSTYGSEFGGFRNQTIYTLNNQQWESPVLHELLEVILPDQIEVHGFLLRHDFARLGSRTLLLNAQQFYHDQANQSLILVAILDITVQSQTMIRAAQKASPVDQEMRELAILAAHDLQEPLRMIISYLSLIQRRTKEQLDAETLKYMKYAVEGASRMREMINDLLEYTRLRIGTDSERGFPLQSVDTAEVFERALALLQFSIEETCADVTVGRLPTVIAADTQLMQLFLNLIGNAIKFRGSEPPRIHIDARFENAAWLFSVKDNGIGIEAQYAEQVFELFRRLHTRTEYAGNGIGLAICKRIVENHGGRIWIESRQGHGTTFYFTLPINPLHREAPLR